MALKRIALRNFVIVQAVEIDLSTGFTALTGETGAGKSILIDALQLLLGARADANVIREGADRADLCAEFDTPPSVDAWLENAGLPKDDHLLLRRTLDTSGRSKAWVNGVPATASQMRELGEYLLDIHGQHAWQSLMRPESMRTLLDAYAGIDAAPIVQAWNRWKAAEQVLAAARKTQEIQQQERERLQWQIEEMGKLAPQSGEWEMLNAQHNRLGHVQALLDAAQEALQRLEQEDAGALQQLARAHQALEAESHLDPEFLNLADVMQSCMDQAQDAAHSLQVYLRKTDTDPEHFAQLDARVSLWMMHARRHRRQPQELAELWQDWKQQLTLLDQATDIQTLQAAAQNLQSAYSTVARDASRLRIKAAPPLARAITAAMQDLGMAGGQFDVSIAPASEAGPCGTENVHFLVAGHAGATPRAIAKVASGGELSRISLAIAVTTSKLGNAPTLIFDEVDAGIGGAVAETVGRLMQQLGKDRQVLAVTHLPQVASCADHHLVVSKQSQTGKATSTVTMLRSDARVEEVARMLGGERRSRASMTHAREMLKAGRTAPQTP